MVVSPAPPAPSPRRVPKTMSRVDSAVMRHDALGRRTSTSSVKAFFGNTVPICVASYLIVASRRPLVLLILTHRAHDNLNLFLLSQRTKLGCNGQARRRRCCGECTTPARAPTVYPFRSPFLGTGIHHPDSRTRRTVRDIVRYK